MELLWQLNEVIPLKGFEQCRIHNDLGTLLLLLLFLLLEDSQKESGGNKLSVAQKIHSLTYSLHIVHITYKPEEAESSGTASQWDRQAARPRPGNTHGFAGRSSRRCPSHPGRGPHSLAMQVPHPGSGGSSVDNLVINRADCYVLLYRDL